MGATEEEWPNPHMNMEYLRTQTTRCMTDNEWYRYYLRLILYIPYQQLTDPGIFKTATLRNTKLKNLV